MERLTIYRGPGEQQETTAGPAEGLGEIRLFTPPTGPGRERPPGKPARIAWTRAGQDRPSSA